MRRAIERAVDALISRMGTYDIDVEKIGKSDAEINVEMRIEDDVYRQISVVSIYIYRDNERIYKNIEQYVLERLEKAAEDYNRNTEADYIEGLTKRQRRDYYAWMA